MRSVPSVVFFVMEVSGGLVDSLVLAVLSLLTGRSSQIKPDTLYEIEINVSKRSYDLETISN